jgi:hypothetical protein
MVGRGVLGIGCTAPIDGLEVRRTRKERRTRSPSYGEEGDGLEVRRTRGKSVVLRFL